MDHLWAPWRLEFVANPKPTHQTDDCFFCRYLAEDKDQANLVVCRTAHSAVILNRFPYNNGHLLVAPRAHKARLHELSSEEALDLHNTLRLMTEHLDALMRPDGYNVGLNLGKAAGAGVPGHLHWHIVPRWNGDTNFMPILSDTKVIVQSLDSLYQLLTTSLRQVASAP